MNAKQKRIWDRLTGPIFGMNPGFYNSDVFAMLALILAYYEAGGSTADQMLASQPLRNLIATYLSNAESDELPNEHRPEQAGRNPTSETDREPVGPGDVQRSQHEADKRGEQE